MALAQEIGFAPGFIGQRGVEGEERLRENQRSGREGNCEMRMGWHRVVPGKNFSSELIFSGAKC
jgi:hypothetical protein